MYAGIYVREGCVGGIGVHKRERERERGGKEGMGESGRYVGSQLYKERALICAVGLILVFTDDYNFIYIITNLYAASIISHTLKL